MTPLYPPGVADPASILVVLPTWVGDFVMATPSLRAIRERFATSRVTFLLEANLADLARGVPWVNDCVYWPARGKRTVFSSEYRRLLKSLRRERYDCAVLLSNSFRSALLARLCGIPNRIGFGRDGRGWLLSHRVEVPNRRGVANSGKIRLAPSLSTTPPVKLGAQTRGGASQYLPMPLVDYYAVLLESLGCRTPTDWLELFVTDECEKSVEKRLVDLQLGDRPLIALSPGAKFGASKCWSPKRFAEVADRLITDRGAALLITCGPGEEPIAGAIAAEMKQRAVALTNPLLSLGELKSLVRRCGLLIANDAGPRHIAKAFGVPVVTVFGPTHPDWTATNYARERIVRVDVDCGPCQQRICPLGHHRCMEDVSVDMVVRAAEELLGKTGKSS